MLPYEILIEIAFYLDYRDNYLWNMKMLEITKCKDKTCFIKSYNNFICTILKTQIIGTEILYDEEGKTFFDKGYYSISEYNDEVFQNIINEYYIEDDDNINL